jgi:hypothetical protein
MICNYGCEQEAKYQFKNGKWCCSESWNQCPSVKKKQHTKEWKENLSKANTGSGNPMFGKPGTQLGKKNPEQSKRMKINNPGVNKTEDTIRKISESHKGEKNYWFGKKRMEHSKIMKELWKNEEYAKRIFSALNVKPNKYELFLESWLNNNFNNEWKFVGDGQLIINGKCPDFVNVNGKK